MVDIWLLILFVDVFVRICIRGFISYVFGLIWVEFVCVSVSHFLYKLWHCAPYITWNRGRDKGTR
jgi:hypothetical protein